MFRLLIGALAALLIGWGATVPAAQAQTLCGSRTDIVKDLKEKFVEEAVAMGLARTGTMVEVFTSTSGSFSILLTHPDGRSCVVATGESWEDLPRRLAGMGI